MTVTQTQFAVDERVVIPVLHVEGGSTAPATLSVAAGSSLRAVADQLGVTLRITHRREPWTQAELDRGILEATIADLRAEFPAGDFPSPVHPADEPCTYCEALRFLDS